MVSIAIAFYNGKKYINEQVESILKQIQAEDEIIISVDDDSDGSGPVLRALSDKDSRVHLIKGPGKGVVANFQNALEHCHGDIIFIADQDDVWDGTKVEKVKAAFEDPKVKAVVHNGEIVDEHLNPLGKTTFQWRNSGTGFWKNIKKNSYIGCCMAVRRDVLSRVLPIPENIWIHDQWIGLLAEQLGKVVFLEECMIFYRRHEENVTGMTHGSIVSMMKKRYHMIMEINSRVRKWRKDDRQNQKNIS